MEDMRGGFAGTLLRKISILMGARTADTNVYFDLEQCTREMALARAVLDAFVKQSSPFDVTMTPAHRFVKDQAVAFAKHIADQMTKEHLTVNHFLDGIENLFFLGLFWRNRDESVAKSVGVDLGRFLDGLIPLIEHAERACNVATTNWDSVGSVIKEQLVSPCTEDSDSKYMPSIEDFELERLLGAGGFGAVYKAYFGDAECTIKLVPRSKLPELENAIADKEVASMINHPCLVQYHATFATTEAYVTVMEYIRGVDVIRLVNLSTRLSEHFVRVILAQLGLALCHLHYKGFVHRDVKPANMMIMVGCRVKLIDFDTAKVCIGKYAKRLLKTFFERTNNEFNDGELAGTISYMAPEMLNNVEYGRAVDWWSFGVTGFHLAVGKLPFALKPTMSFNSQKSMVCTLTHHWPRAIRVSKHLRSLTKACLRKKVSARLCSKQYSDFAKHPFFKGLDLRWVETSSELIRFDPFNSVAVGALTYDVVQQCDSPEATPTAHSKSQLLFPSLDLSSTPDQVRLFTFMSPGFKQALSMIQRGEVPADKDIRISPELVDFEETANVFFFTSKTDS